MTAVPSWEVTLLRRPLGAGRARVAGRVVVEAADLGAAPGGPGSPRGALGRGTPSEAPGLAHLPHRLVHHRLAGVGQGPAGDGRAPEALVQPEGGHRGLGPGRRPDQRRGLTGAHDGAA